MRIMIAPFAVALALLGCQRVNTAAGPGAPNAKPAISFNISEDPHSLNPVLAQNDDERQVAHLMFDMLLDVDPQGRQIPALATAVPTIENEGVSRDGRTIVYHLRRDVVWQDGVAFTSRDVAFTWKAIVDPESNVQSTHGYDEIVSIDTPDPHTAVMHLRHPWAPAVGTLFTYGANPVPIVPAHLLEGKGPLTKSPFNTHPIGTGPYVLDRWERGDRLIFRANPRYFRGKPKTDTIVAVQSPDINTSMTLLRSGQLHWSLLSPAQRLALGRPKGIRFVYAPFSGFGAIAFNCRSAPFDDPRMRRAVAMAIDRKRLSDAITKGQYPTIDSDQPPFSWAYDAGAHLPGYDPKAADAALDGLGYKRGPDGTRVRSGRPLEVVFATFPEGDTAVRTAQYVQQMLRERGVAVTVKKVSVTQFYLPKSEGGLLMSGKYDMAYIAWRTGEDPDDSDIVTCAGPSNYTGYCNRKLDRLEAQALVETSRAARAALYSRIQRVLAVDVPYDYLYAPTYGFAATTELQGFAPTPYSPTWNAYEWRLGR